VRGWRRRCQRRPAAAGHETAAGSWASARSTTSMWSAAVLEPALPGR